MAILEKKYECCPREELEQVQLERLQSSLNRAYKSVAFYRSVFDRLGIVPEDIGSRDDFVRLPFTTRKDLQDNYPYGMFAVPLREVVRVHTATETTDTPTIVGYSRNDLKNWAGLVARFLTAAGVTDEDVIQIAFRYGLFTGAFGLHHGAERIGASVIPASGGNTRKQIRIMQDYRTSVLATTPSFALILAEEIGRMRIDPKSLHLKKALLGGEIWSEQTRREIEDRLLVRAYDNYGVSELMGPGIAGECDERAGLHVFEDHFLPEVIDPATGAVLPPGATGELVLTTLTREAFPLIRYRTGDLTRLETAPCACGRTLARMQRIAGRTDDIIIIKGVNVVPGQIEKILADIEGCAPHYQIIATRTGNRDELEVHVEVSEQVFSDEIKHQERFRDNVRDTLSRRLGLRVQVKLVEHKTLAEAVRNNGTVIDRRRL